MVDRSISQLPTNALRGFAIGMAELVPGISGGTVALVVGVYERALEAGNGLFKFATGREKIRNLDWWLMIPVGIGMVLAVFSMSGVMHTFVEKHTEVARALFLGMVAVSLYVPLSMARPVDRKWMWLAFVGSAALTFIATGFTSTQQDNPSLVVIFFAAMFAVIALVLPGVSGSFLLLALGLYGPVMEAVSERNVPFMLTFAAGAFVGLALFVRTLNWLLHNHRTLTLVIMAGLMLGSLRALWPWQGDDASLELPPTIGSGAEMAAWALLGAAVIGATLIAEKRLKR